MNTFFTRLISIFLIPVLFLDTSQAALFGKLFSTASLCSVNSVECFKNQAILAPEIVSPLKPLLARYRPWFIKAAKNKITWEEFGPVFRIASKEDAGGVSQLHQQAFGSSDYWMNVTWVAERLEPQLERPIHEGGKRFFVIAEQAGRIIGMVRITQTDQSKIEISDLATDKKFFRQGTARGVMKKAIEISRKYIPDVTSARVFCAPKSKSSDLFVREFGAALVEAPFNRSLYQFTIPPAASQPSREIEHVAPSGQGRLRSVGTWVAMLLLGTLSGVSFLGHGPHGMSGTTGLLALGLLWIHQALVHEGIGHELLNERTIRPLRMILLDMFLMRGPPATRQGRDSYLNAPAYSLVSGLFGVAACLLLWMYHWPIMIPAIAVTAVLLATLIDSCPWIPHTDAWNARRAQSAADTTLTEARPQPEQSHSSGEPNSQLEKNLGVLSEPIRAHLNELPIENPELRRYIREWLGKSPLNLYGTTNGSELAKALSMKFGLSENRILISGMGSANLLPDILDYGRQSGDILYPVPNFKFFGEWLEVNSPPIKLILDAKNFELDPEAVRAELRGKKMGLVVITNPSNPTGAYVNPLQFDSLIHDFPDTLFLFDEAYAEFVDQDARPLLKYENVLILRTFSKCYGMAALRVGYLLADTDVISALRKIKHSHTLWILQEKAAIYAIEHPEFIQKTRELIKAWREDFVARLQTIPGVHVFPSVAHFVFINLDAWGVGAGQALTAYLKAQNILIQDTSHTDGAKGEYVRITLCTPKENARMAAEIQRFYNTHILKSGGANVSKSGPKAELSPFFGREGYSIVENRYPGKGHTFIDGLREALQQSPRRAFIDDGSPKIVPSSEVQGGEPSLATSSQDEPNRAAPSIWVNPRQETQEKLKRLRPRCIIFDVHGTVVRSLKSIPDGEDPMGDLLPGIEVFLNAIGALKDIRRLLITSGMGSDADTLQRGLGLDGVYRGEDKTKGFQNLLLQENLLPEEAILVGNSLNEADAANATGVLSVVYAPIAGVAKDIVRFGEPDIIVKDYQTTGEMLKTLKLISEPGVEPRAGSPSHSVPGNASQIESQNIKSAGTNPETVPPLKSELRKFPGLANIFDRHFGRVTKILEFEEDMDFRQRIVRGFIEHLLMRALSYAELGWSQNQVNRFLTIVLSEKEEIKRDRFLPYWTRVAAERFPSLKIFRPFNNAVLDEILLEIRTAEKEWQRRLTGSSSFPAQDKKNAPLLDHKAAPVMEDRGNAVDILRFALYPPRTIRDQAEIKNDLLNQPLTGEETTVFSWVCQGYSTLAIAQEFGTLEKRIWALRNGIRAKLGIPTVPGNAIDMVMAYGTGLATRPPEPLIESARAFWAGGLLTPEQMRLVRLTAQLYSQDLVPPDVLLRSIQRTQEVQQAEIVIQHYLGPPARLVRYSFSFNLLEAFYAAGYLEEGKPRHAEDKRNDRGKRV